MRTQYKPAIHPVFPHTPVAQTRDNCPPEAIPARGGRGVISPRTLGRDGSERAHHMAEEGAHGPNTLVENGIKVRVVLALESPTAGGGRG